MTTRTREQQLSEIYDHALYDKVHLGTGAPIEELRFFNLSVGYGARLFRSGTARSDISASLGDTNTYIAGTIAPGQQAVVGLAHRLHTHPWLHTRGETWWLGAAQGAYVDLRVVDKVYLTLPLTSLPLLGTFESPFSEASETLERYDAEGNLAHREVRRWAITRHWPLEPPLVIRHPQTFAVLVRFPSPVHPPLELDVEVMLLGQRQRAVV